MAAVSICSDFGAPQNKVSHCFHCFPIYLPWSDGTGCHDLSFLFVELLALLFTFLSSLTFIMRLFSSSSLSAIKVVSSAYLRLLIFLLAILISACASSSPAFLMKYSTYNLNKQGDKGWGEWIGRLELTNRHFYMQNRLLMKTGNLTQFSLVT